LAFERRARTLHGAVDVLTSRVRDLRDHLAGCRVAHIEHGAAPRLDFAAIDEIAVDFDGGRASLRRDVHAFPLDPPRTPALLGPSTQRHAAATAHFSKILPASCIRGLLRQATRLEKTDV